jgi:LPS sulfotransferase NodH
MSRPTSFVVLTTQRSGSSWLVDLLNDHPNVVAYGELFRVTDATIPPYGATSFPRFEVVVPRAAYSVSNVLVGRRYAYVRGLARAHRDAHAVGFKLMYDQTRDHQGLLEILALSRFRVIHLVRRDHVRAVISFDIASRRGSWHRHLGEAGAGARVRIEAETLFRRLERREREIQTFRRRLRRLPLRALEVHYERLVHGREETLRSIFEFLRVAPAGAKVTSTLVPSGPELLADAIENLGDVRSVLARTRFAAQASQLS